MVDLFIYLSVLIELRFYVYSAKTQCTLECKVSNDNTYNDNIIIVFQEE